MSFPEYSQYDAIGLTDLIKKKKISAREAVDEAIARAEKLNPKLNAIVFEAYDQAREAAKKPARGPLSGVPMVLKDMRAGAIGMPTRNGSRFSPMVLSDHDATNVARFKAAGLIPMGKTNVPEFGILPTTEGRLYGPAHNPWNLAHTPGGSSGGSAASVAAGIVPIAHSTDGGGSIRIPASNCGLVGLKVSRGRISQGPDFSDSTSGLSVDNVVTKSVRDTALALDLASVIDYGDPYFALPPQGSYLEGIKRKPKRMKIAVALKALDGKPFHPDVAAAMKKAVKLSEELGHTVEEALPALDSASTTMAFMTMWAANTALAVIGLSRATGKEPSLDLIEGLTMGLYKQGREIPAVQYLAMQQTLHRAARVTAKFHETYDLWLTLTLASPPLKLGIVNVDEQDVRKAFEPILGYVPFTAMQNATGQPAINLPLHWNKDNLPIGVQFVARSGDEMTLLKLAAEIEKAAPWAMNYSKIAV
ncbi:MAG: amidase [Proteobacteria bacterium]|nr:amidase [Pseudomonadota bacterium]